MMVDDVDAHFRHAQEQGAMIDYEPVDQPYGLPRVQRPRQRRRALVVHEAARLTDEFRAAPRV